MIQVLRLLTIVMGGALLGMSLAVFISYSRKAREKGRPLLPRHVALISLSYCILIAGLMVDQGIRLAADSKTTWRLFVSIPAMVIGIWALWTVLASLQPKQPDTREDDWLA